MGASVIGWTRRTDPILSWRWPPGRATLATCASGGEDKPGSTEQLLFGSAEIFTGSRVHGDQLTDANERRHGDLEPGLENGRLELRRRRRALHGRLGVDDLQVDRRRQVDTERLALVQNNLDH